MARKSGSRNFTMTLDPDLDDVVVRHMNEMGITSKQIAVKDLLWIGIASTPKDGTLRGAREAAYRRTTAWLVGRLREWLHDIAEQVTADLSDTSEQDGGTTAAPVDPSAPLKEQL